MIPDKKGTIQTAKELNEKYKKIRLGEEKIMNNGQKAVIIAYRNAKDIDIQFEDKTIVKCRTYHSFQKGKISNPNHTPHLDETKIMKNGMKATIVVYRKIDDIDIRFEDGTIVTGKRYDHFLNGTIKNPSILLNRVGESKIMQCGMKATIIHYENNRDIDVQFEDGTIIRHRAYQHFQIGNIINPNIIPHLGESRIMNNGQKATIIDYRAAKDIDIRFEDGTIVNNKDLYAFKRGNILNPNFRPKLYEEKIMNNGMKATIIVYRNSHDIDVQFEDETVVKHKTYQSFQKGEISNPNYNPYSHLGETKMMNNGLKATIISYRTSNDIDIKFEDEIIVSHIKYDSFYLGQTMHPNLSRYKQTQTIFHHFEVKLAARTKDKAFYKCKCLNCGQEDLMTPQQMIQHEREEIEKQNTIVEEIEEVEEIEI